MSLAPEASLVLAWHPLSISPAALNSSGNCEVLQDVVARLRPLTRPLIQIFAFPADSCGCNTEVSGCHLEGICQSASHVCYGLLSPLTYLVSRVHREVIYGASPSCVGRWARAMVENSFQAVKIILRSAEMDPHQPEPGTTRDLLRFQ